MMHGPIHIRHQLSVNQTRQDKIITNFMAPDQEMRSSYQDYESGRYILHRDIPKYINTIYRFSTRNHLNYI